jgi:hypothetical protein
MTDFDNPVTDGTEVDDATVTLINETTTQNKELTREPAAGGNSGYYEVQITPFLYSAGDSIKAKIVLNDDDNTTYNGGPATVPDSSITVTSGALSGAQPYILTWIFNAGTYQASSILIRVYNGAGVNTWDIIPTTQTSYTVDGFPAGAGYTIEIWPINTLNFSDSAADGSIYIAAENFFINRGYLTGSL